MLNHICYFHFMYLICHSSRLMSLSPSHTTVDEHEVFFPTGWVLPQSRWKFFIPDKCGVLYIIRAYYKPQCISIFFLEGFGNKLYSPSTYLNGSLSWQEPPNLQSNLWLSSWTFLCFLTLFLLVHLPCSVYFLQVDHICSMIFASWTHQLCSQCMAYLFTILIFLRSVNSIAHYSLTNKTHSHQHLKHQHEITHFEVTFQLAWSYLQLYLAPVIRMLDSTIQRMQMYMYTNTEDKIRNLRKDINRNYNQSRNVKTNRK